MIDVFISFSSKAANDKEQYKRWVTTFRKKLAECYKNNYAKDLQVWDDIQKNGPGNIFIAEIDEALAQTNILLTILDPAYIYSPQALDEVDKYERIMKKSGEPLNILKVVKLLGDKTDDIMDFIDSTIVMSFFSKKDDNDIEQPFASESEEYNNEITKLVVSIRKFVVEQKRKSNCKIIIDRLEFLKNQALIYVALGSGTLKDNRIKFINELIGTLKGNNNLPEIKIFPDDLTWSLVDYESLGQLLFEDNPYREKCLAAMLDASKATLIPIEYDNNSEANEIKRNISYQLDTVKKRAQNNMDHPVYMLFNLPEKLKASSPFNEVINNPVYISYEHIKIQRDQNIATFINLFVKELEVNMAPQAAFNTNTDGKSIYLIEYDGHVTVSANEQTSIEMERVNRLKVRAQIANQYTLMSSLVVSNDLRIAIKQQKEWLGLCDGIIIYRGIIEHDKWCIEKQAATYKALSQLSNKRNLKRAVYVDPLQKNRDHGEYSFYKYEVITNDPPTPELNTFLCRI